MGTYKFLDRELVWSAFGASFANSRLMHDNLKYTVRAFIIKNHWEIPQTLQQTSYNIYWGKTIWNEATP